jgi:hypothetical protein
VVIPGGLWDREVIQELAKAGIGKLFEKRRNTTSWCSIRTRCWQRRIRCSWVNTPTR